MVRGKKRIGYELEMKVRFKGGEKFNGIEASIELSDFCDDGSDPDFKLYVTKEKSPDQGLRFKKEFATKKIIKEFIAKCKEILTLI